MKTYLVGGAVRDELLGRTVTERDWVVVGATPEQMLEQGFKPVGRDFPVFLHPKTHEEYALARTERKSGSGYRGFDVYAAPDVTLEEDLLRRDLTINAIARDDEGNLIDPYGGVKDLEARKLRHVSQAFAEDPVRILRIARFEARYAHLGFEVTADTMSLMKQMVEKGEVDALVAERVWKEFVRALSETQPERFIDSLRACGALTRIMPELDALFGVPQRSDYHPEVDSGIHALKSLQSACLLTEETQVRFAALFHDLGKALTPEEILPSHHGHEDAGVEPLKRLCKRLGCPRDYFELALITNRFHTLIHRADTLRAKTVLKVLMQTDAVRRPERFMQLLIVCKADKQGRTGFESSDYPQHQFWVNCLRAVEKVDIKDLVDQGKNGQEIGEQLHVRRIAAINQCMTAD